MLDLYLLFKWLHIVSVISWMVGLLYLPRLFVYHADCGLESVQSETFKLMERRLYKVIMRPAMIASWLFGLALIYVRDMGWDLETWLILKLLLLCGLTGFHFYLSNLVTAFAANRVNQSPKFFRFINEIPTAVMLIVVLLAVFKPF